jgi:hypothetical protein
VNISSPGIAVCRLMRRDCVYPPAASCLGSAQSSVRCTIGYAGRTNNCSISVLPPVECCLPAGWHSIIAYLLCLLKPRIPPRHSAPHLQCRPRNPTHSVRSCSTRTPSTHHSWLASSVVTVLLNYSLALSLRRPLMYRTNLVRRKMAWGLGTSPRAQSPTLLLSTPTPMTR